jgi:hypothetical protein
MNVRKEMSARDTGYIYFGMAFAAVQAVSQVSVSTPIADAQLGVNLNASPAYIVLSTWLITV